MSLNISNALYSLNKKHLDSINKHKTLAKQLNQLEAVQAWKSIFNGTYKEACMFVKEGLCLKFYSCYFGFMVKLLHLLFDF